MEAVHGLRDFVRYGIEHRDVFEVEVPEVSRIISFKLSESSARILEAVANAWCSGRSNCKSATIRVLIAIALEYIEKHVDGDYRRFKDVVDQVHRFRIRDLEAIREKLRDKGVI